MREIICINGRVVGKKAARISVYDHALLYGDGLFETMRAYGGKIFRQDQHLRRFYDGAGILKIRIPYGKTYLKDKISHLAARIDSENTYVRLAVTRGEGRIGLDPGLCKRSNVILWLNAFDGYPDSYYDRGAALAISSIRCNNHSPLARIKTSNYLNNILAFMEAGEQGKDDAVILNTDGFVAETTSGNIFMVKDNTVITPGAREGLLSGITRRAILELAPCVGFKTAERRIGLPELKNANEIFITSSIVEVRGVVRLGAKKVSKGKIGPVTRLLHARYRQLVKKEHRKNPKRGSAL